MPDADSIADFDRYCNRDSHTYGKGGFVISGFCQPVVSKPIAYGFYLTVTECFVVRRVACNCIAVSILNVVCLSVSIELAAFNPVLVRHILINNHYDSGERRNVEAAFC